jgi:hypothetical protein
MIQNRRLENQNPLVTGGNSGAARAEHLREFSLLGKNPIDFVLSQAQMAAIWGEPIAGP